MEKRIKTKEKLTTIKELDKKENIKHFSKPIHIKEKVDKIQNKQINRDENQKNAPQQSAVQSITNQEKRIVHDSAFYAKKFVRNRNEKQNLNRQVQSHSLNGVKNIKTRSAFIEKRKKDLLNAKSLKLKQPSLKADTNTTIVNSNQVPFRSVNRSDYQKHMKHHVLKKHKQKIKESKQTATTMKTIKDKVSDVFKGTAIIVRKAVTSVNNLIAAGSFLIFLVVLILFMAVFSVLSSDSGINSESLPLSPEVLAYTETIEKYAKDYDMEAYINIIQAVMMQESGGQGNDPMQASECPYNEKYPRKPNGITDTDYSIQVGIHYLSDCFKSADVKDAFDRENISLALQGYNYGNGYISWAIKNFGEYSKANAKVFSDMKKDELGWTTYGDPDYVSHVLRYWHFRNADIVIVAKSQIGNVGGKPYWSWYGYEHRVEWCACFVSWCANESGVLDITIPKFASVEDGIQWYKNKNSWSNRNYIPKSGDLIFFDWQNDNNPDHVGIVERVDNNTIYTIEGNSHNECRERSYSIRSNVIFGYGIS
ncbi:lysozyme family protein [[Clostridium] innocuum]|uniref:lysozyme family protein n=1 Tax=Clostridium innocuum TaxID=1522 RepID=UPI001EDEB5BF|nr:lysozyme family protein [[Clostridium] innocuum]MCG4663141.1 lysozyme family protein [[Clostridium] innocuum]